MKRGSEMRRFAAVAALVIVTVMLASCSQAPKTYELTIIGTADLQGMLEPVSGEADLDGDGVPEPVETGGIARLGTKIQRSSRSIRSAPSSSPAAMT